MTIDRHRQPEDAASQEGDGPQPGSRLIILGFWLLIGFYFLLFLLSNAKRLVALSFILLPDQIALSWVDGQWSRFGLLDRVPILLGAAVVLLTSYTLGRLAMELVRADLRLTQLELLSFATGVGLNLISLYILAVGLGGGLRFRAAFIIPAVLVLGAGAFRAKDWYRKSRSDSVNDNANDSVTRLVLWLSVPFLLAILGGSLLPPWHFDVREYHLQVPKEWYQAGGIGFMPHNVYGNMPLGAELHAILGMNMFRGELDWWWGALVGKVIIASYSILTMIALVAFGHRFASLKIGVIAAFLYISTPWVIHVSASGLIDAVSGFYLFAAFYAFLLRKQPRDEDRASPEGLMLLCGFMAGAAVACKYPALAFVVAPIGIGVLAVSRANWKPCLIYSMAVVLACGLWFGKNAVLSGNPAYPLLYEVFGGRTRTLEKHKQWTRAHRTPKDAIGSSFRLGQLRMSAELLLWKSDFASPLLVPLVALALFTQRRNKTLLLVAGFAFANIVLWWLLTHRIDRFLVPILPLVGLLAAYGANWAYEAAGRRSFVVCLVIGSIFNLLYFASPIPGDNRFLTSLELLRADSPPDYAFAGERVHAAHKEINARVRPGYRVLLVGEAQAFAIEPDVLYNTCFDDCLFEQMMKGKSANERIAAFRAQRISHVFVYWYELDRYRSPGNYGYSDYVTPELIEREFFRTRILREIPLRVDRENSQLFEVVGWENWE